jgi:hypothetical protein
MAVTTAIEAQADVSHVAVHLDVVLPLKEIEACSRSQHSRSSKRFASQRWPSRGTSSNDIPTQAMTFDERFALLVEAE